VCDELMDEVAREVYNRAQEREVRMIEWYQSEEWFPSQLVFAGNTALA